MSRVLPGGIMVVAALTMPELSVGAGDLGGGDHADDPPLPPPPSLKQNPTARLGAVKGRPGFEGLRYASIINLEPAPTLTLTPAMEYPGAREAEAVPPAPLLAPASVAASLPVEAVPPPALVPPPVVQKIIEAPRAAETAPVTAIVPPPTAPVAATLTVPAVSEPAAGVTNVPARSMTGGQNELTQASAAAVAVAVSPPEPAAPPARIAAISAPVPAGRGVGAAAVAAPSTPAQAAAFPSAASRVSASATAPAIRAAGPTSAKPPASSIAAVPQPRPAMSAPLAAGNSPFPLDVKAQLLTRVDGKAAGALDFQQTPEGLKLRLGSVVELLADRFAPDQIARIRASSAGNAYVSLADLQAKGIPISYDPVYDEFNVGLTDTRPKAARKVHIDQITTPERGIEATGMAQVPRPR